MRKRGRNVLRSSIRLRLYVGEGIVNKRVRSNRRCRNVFVEKSCVFRAASVIVNGIRGFVKWKILRKRGRNVLRSSIRLRLYVREGIVSKRVRSNRRCRNVFVEKSCVLRAASVIVNGIRVCGMPDSGSWLGRWLSGTTKQQEPWYHAETSASEAQIRNRDCPDREW